MQAQLRPYDRVYRYGGDEFLLLMPQVTVETALQLTERLRAAVA
ncbi:MAG: diguanylate cyclase domain-containing protein, partial [Solirubrobacteraceae bacterium]